MYKYRAKIQGSALYKCNKKMIPGSQNDDNIEWIQKDKMILPNMNYLTISKIITRQIQPQFRTHSLYQQYQSYMIQQRYFSADYDLKYKIIMIGDVNVGKTAFFSKYVEGQFPDQKSASVTIIDFKIKQIKIDSHSIKIYIWDTVGQEKYRSVVSSYFNGCDGVMLMYDLTNTTTCKNVITKWYELAKSRCPSAQFMLIGNKSDLAPTTNDWEAENWAKQNQIRFIKTSAKNDINVNESFRQLCEVIYRQPLFKKPSSFVLKKEKKKKKKEKQQCC